MKVVMVWVVGLLLVVGAGVGVDTAAGGKVSVPYVNAQSFLGQDFAPQFVQIYPVQTIASSFLPADPPANISDGDTTTFWAANTRIPITALVPFAKTVKQVGPDGHKHTLKVKAYHLERELSAPGVGASVTLIYNKPQRISAVSIIPGNQFPESEFTRFGHPARVEFVFSWGAPLFFTVPNDPEFFQETFSPPRDSGFVELKVLSTYAGSGKNEYDAVTEFAAYEELFAP